MIVEFRIENILLIKKADFTFDKGLCVFTGETGAGKSIVLGAMGYLIGNKTKDIFIQDPDKKGLIYGKFDISNNIAANKLLEEASIDIDDGELHIRRVINSSKKQITFVNDVNVSVNFLKKLGESLIEIHGQNDQKGLLDEKNHIHILDQYCLINDSLNELEILYKNYTEIDNKINEINSQKNKLFIEKEFIKNTINELKEIDIQDNEEIELIEKRKFLSDIEKNSKYIENALTAIQESEEKLNESEKYLLKIDSDKIDNIMKVIESSVLELSEAKSQLQEINSSNNSESLQDIEERLFKIRSLSRKLNINSTEFVNFLNELEEKYKIFDDDGSLIQELEKAKAKTFIEYNNIANKISKVRKEKAKEIESLFLKELPDLKLDNASIFFDIQEGSMKKSGYDNVCFKIKTNPQMDYSSISKAASGGELSRIMLCLKTIFSKNKESNTLIFDEIDTGVGGATASAIGQKLNSLSNKSQIIVVTHQPQVAAFGNCHYKIIKQYDKSINENYTTIAKLSKNDINEELARMLSGKEISDEARAAAKQLMEVK